MLALCFINNFYYKPTLHLILTFYANKFSILLCSLCVSISFYISFSLLCQQVLYFFVFTLYFNILLYIILTFNANKFRYFSIYFISILNVCQQNLHFLCSLFISISLCLPTIFLFVFFSILQSSSLPAKS